MFFSKSFVAAAAVLLGLTLQAHAHAGVTPALGVKANFARGNVQRPSAAKPCGNINVAQTLDASTPITANADGTFVATITNFNAYARCRIHSDYFEANSLLRTVVPMALAK